MLEEIRQRLKRQGLLSNLNMMINNQNGLFNPIGISTNKDLFKTQLSDETQQFDGASVSIPDTTQASGLVPPKYKEKSFLQRSLKNLLSSTFVELTNTDINFYMYQDSNVDQKNGPQPIFGVSDNLDEELDFQNIKKFHQVMTGKKFLQKNLCFRLHFPNGQMKVNAISDEDFDLNIKGTRCLLVNPCHSNKQGLIEDFQVSLKLPIQRKMLQFVGNYDISIKIQKACFDMNKKFIKKFTKWFVGFYTIRKIIQVAKNIILKTHYQDEILKNQAMNSFSGTEVTFENYRDTMIPKRLKITIQEGVDLIITDDCKQLIGFLDSSQKERNSEQKRSSAFSFCGMDSKTKSENKKEFSLLRLEKTTFELLRKMQNTYYIIVRTDKAELSINENYEALKITGFSQEMDFTFRKENNDLPVKKSKLLCQNKIKLDQIDCNMTASLFNFIQEILNMYKSMIWFSSIKSKINGMLLDEDFLKNNVLLINQQKKGTEYERKILQLYKPQKYQDEIAWQITLKELKIKVERDLERNLREFDDFADEKPNDLLLGIFVKSSGIEYLWKMAHGKINQTLTLQQLSMQPHQNKFSSMRRSQTFTDMPRLAIFASKNLKYESLTHLSDTRKQIEQNFSAQRLQIDINYEVLLDMSPELIDFWFIFTHFQNKWNTKYKVRDPIPCDITERTIDIKEFTLIWNLSTSRILSFNFKEVKSMNEYLVIDGKNYVSKDGQQKLTLQCKEGQIMHYKYFNDSVDEFYRNNFVPIQNTMIIGNGQGLTNPKSDADQIQEMLFLAENMEIRYEVNKLTKSFKILGKKAVMDIPDKFHFSSVIYEMQKQWYHSNNWFNAKIAERKEELSFKFKKWRQQHFNELEKMAQEKAEQEMELAKSNKNLHISFLIKDANFSVQENKLKKAFVDKDEIVDLLQQKDYFRVKQSTLENHWAKLQKINLNEKYLHIKGKNFGMQYEVPSRFRNKEYILDLIKSLDEGRDFINPETFKSFVSGIHNFRLDYGYMMARNMRRPVVELWKINWKQTIIAATPSPDSNLQLFTTNIQNKIFNRFDLPKFFNRLPSKIYFDMSIDIQRLRVNIQGQQTLLFFNDLFQQLVSRFLWEDISRGCDPDKKYLKYLMGMDKNRAKLHGQFKISLLNSQISIFSKRNSKKYDQQLQIHFNDLIYYQVYQKQQICLRDLIIKKEPLLQFETLTAKIPLIEVKYTMEFNDGLTIDHQFSQQKVKTMEDWLDRVQRFMAKSQRISIKLNLPTLGCYNETERKCLYLPLLMQSYAQNSPLPIIHFQRSHLAFFNDFKQEFQHNRIDISGKAVGKTLFNSINQNNRYTRNFMPKKIEKQRTKFQAFINDIIIISSHFDEEHDFGNAGLNNQADMFGGLAIDEQCLSPEEIEDHTKKDNYLKIYDGILISTENVCVQSDFTYQPNHVNYFEINDSLASFNLLRFCKMTSKNLFKIRNPCFNIHRNIQYEQSLNNYYRFCQFFELDEQKPLMSNEFLVKKKFPQFIIPPIELLDQDMDIVEHQNYVRTYGKQPTRNHVDSNLHYKQLLGNFKTFYPKYILYNAQIQKQIQRIQTETSKRSSVLEGDIKCPNDQNLEDDFIFSDSDTIGTVIHSEYRQDQMIKYQSINQAKSEKSNELIQVKHLIDIRGVRILFTKKIFELIHNHTVKGFDYNQFKKTNYIDKYQINQEENRNIFLEFDNAQAGKWKNQSSLMVNFKALKKEAIVAIRLEQAQINFQNSLTESQMLIASPRPVVCVIFAYYKNKAPSLLLNEEFLFLQRNQSQAGSKENEELKQEFEDQLIGLLQKYESGQSQDQSGQSQSQDQSDIDRIKSLKQSIQKRQGIARGYFMDPLNRDCLSLKVAAANYTGYQFATNKDIIKSEMEISVREMDCYVAPTFINIENPTFWMNKGNVGVTGFRDQNKFFNMSGDSPLKRRPGTPPGSQKGPNQFSQGSNFNMNTGNFEFAEQSAFDDIQEADSQGIDSENLLRKIIFINDISFNFGFLNADFVDNLNPALTLDILVERLEGSMNGSEWTRFYDIIEQLVMSRGEKAAEVILIENRRSKEMKRMKTEFIRDIINSKLKNQYKEMQNEEAPEMSKCISYSINSGSIKLFNHNKQFSALDVKGVHGKSLIYSNRKSKQDLDIERITIENLLDGENYRWVLYPGDSTVKTTQYTGSERSQNRTMIQSRIKDRYIVVSEAPWRVYDQIELDIYPSIIQLTRNLYLQFKKFLFDQHYSNITGEQKKLLKKKDDTVDASGQDKKYNLLVPTKHTKKQNQMLSPVVQTIHDEYHSNDSKSDSKSESQKLSEQSDGNKMKLKGLDGKFTGVLNGVVRKSSLENTNKPQNIFQALATQRNPQNQPLIPHQKEGLRNTSKKKKVVVQDFPIFFKYFRMNEISMTITYYHEKNSFLNSKDLKVKLAPFISHNKFLSLKRMFDQYESHCKKNFVSQIPNILKQKFLKAKQKVDQVASQGVTSSLMQGVHRVRDLAVGHVVVARKMKKKKDHEERKKKREGQGLESSQNLASESEENSQESSDSEADEETKKAEKQYLLEIKETKLREARKILFGDFAIM